MARIWASGAEGREWVWKEGGGEWVTKEVEKCPVHWGDAGALTEDEPDDCEGLPEYLVYLDCGHESTIAHKKDTPVKVCHKHAEYVINSGNGICGCSWVILPLRVNLIASGYEWICPHCECLNTEIEIVSTMDCAECYTSFTRGEVHHAYE